MNTRRNSCTKTLNRSRVNARYINGCCTAPWTPKGIASRIIIKMRTLTMWYLPYLRRTAPMETCPFPINTSKRFCIVRWSVRLLRSGHITIHCFLIIMILPIHHCGAPQAMITGQRGKTHFPCTSPALIRARIDCVVAL